MPVTIGQPGAPSEHSSLFLAPGPCPPSRHLQDWRHSEDECLVFDCCDCCDLKVIKTALAG